jgi:hypothetical protein
MVIECRTRPRKDGSMYTNCYGEGEMSKKSSSINKSNNNNMNTLAELEEDIKKGNRSFKSLPQMYIIESKGDKYLDARTPKGNPIKIEERVTYKSKDAPMSMLVMPKDGNNLMVKAGKKKGNNFTFALSKLQAGLNNKTMVLKKVKAVPTKEWEGSHKMPDGSTMKGTKEAVHGGSKETKRKNTQRSKKSQGSSTPRGVRPKTPPRRQRTVGEAPASRLARLEAQGRRGSTPKRRRPSEGVPPGSKRGLLKSGYAI